MNILEYSQIIHVHESRETVAIQCTDEPTAWLSPYLKFQKFFSPFS